MGRPKKDPDERKKQRNIRMADSLVKDVEDFIKRFTEETGMTVTFAEAVRVLLADGIKTRKSKHTRRKNNGN